MKKRLPDFILKRSPFITGIVLLLMTGTLFLLPKAHLENNIHDWINKEDPLYQSYQKLTHHFKNDEYLQFSFNTQAILNDSLLKDYVEFLELLTKDPNVEDFIDPISLFLEENNLNYNELYTNPSIHLSKLNTFIQTLSQHQGWSQLVLSKDKQTSALIVFAQSSSKNKNQTIYEDLNFRFKQLNISFDTTGPIYFSKFLATSLKKDLTKILPLLLILSFLILMFYFKSFKIAFCVSMGTLFSVLTTLCLFPLFKVSITLASLIIFPLLFCIVTTLSIHLFYKIALNKHASHPFKKAYKETFTPGLMASFTTALGTTAFLFSPQQAISLIGWIAPIGIFLAFVSAYFFIPSLYHLLNGNFHSIQAFTFKIKGFQKQSKPVALLILVLFCLITLFLGFQLNKLKINSDALFFFKQDSPLIKSYQSTEKNLTGTLTVQLLLQSLDKQPLTNKDSLNKIYSFEQRLQTIPELTKINSIFDPLDEALKKMHRGGLNKNHNNHPLLIKALRKIEQRSPQAKTIFLTESEETSRMTLRFKNFSDKRFPEIKKNIETIWRDISTENVRISITGIIPLILESQTQLLANQVKTFILLILLISLCFLILFKSIKIAFISMIANIFPIIITAGIMSLLNISINNINVFVAAVLIGVIVDDTIFLLYTYKNKKNMAEAVKEIGPAIGLTSIVVCLGFSSLLISNFIPIIQFSILSMIAIFSAYLCDLFMLPALVQFLPKMEPNNDISL